MPGLNDVPQELLDRILFFIYDPWWLRIFEHKQKEFRTDPEQDDTTEQLPKDRRGPPQVRRTLRITGLPSISPSLINRKFSASAQCACRAAFTGTLVIDTNAYMRVLPHLPKWLLGNIKELSDRNSGHHRWQAFPDNLPWELLPNLQTLRIDTRSRVLPCENHWDVDAISKGDHYHSIMNLELRLKKREFTSCTVLDAFERSLNVVLLSRTKISYLPKSGQYGHRAFQMDIMVAREGQCEEMRLVPELQASGALQDNDEVVVTVEALRARRDGPSVVSAMHAWLDDWDEDGGLYDG